MQYSKISYAFDSEPKLIWQSDSVLKIGDILFRLSIDTAELQQGKSSGKSFLLGKPRGMVEKSFALSKIEKIEKIFEMGILQGGSVVLYDQIFQPKKIAAIEYMSQPVDSLARYISERNRHDVVRPYYGVNQADGSAMNGILEAEFPKCDIDLVIDDASHFYEETRAAFNTVFPYLKANGLYVIEDWAWAHWSGDYWQNGNKYLDHKVALSNLLTELFMLTASRPDIISDIQFDHASITVRKGHGFVPTRSFNISDHYLLRGKNFHPLL